MFHVVCGCGFENQTRSRAPRRTELNGYALFEDNRPGATLPFIVVFFRTSPRLAFSLACLQARLQASLERGRLAGLLPSERMADQL